MSYLCYFLTNSTKERFTYVGITNNFARRLRQHNGEIVGGARYTKRYRPWRPFIQVTGFRSKTEVLQFEWAMKKRRRGGGVKGRIRTLEYLLDVDRWTSKAPEVRGMFLTVRVWMNEPEYRAHASAKKREWANFEFLL